MHVSPIRLGTHAATAVLAVIALSCSPSERARDPASGSPTEGSAVEASAAETPPASTGTSEAVGPAPTVAPPVETTSPPPVESPPGASGPGAIPPAIARLEEKLRPPAGSLPPTATPNPPRKQDESPLPAAQASAEETTKMLAQAESTIRTLAEAIARGDTKAAEAVFFGVDDFAKTLSPGYRDILQETLVNTNRTLIDSLVSSLGGKNLRPSWEPGSLVRSPGKAVFKDPQWVLSEGNLTLEADGVQVPLRIDQMVLVDGQWRIFRANTK